MCELKVCTSRRSSRARQEIRAFRLNKGLQDGRHPESITDWRHIHLLPEARRFLSHLDDDLAFRTSMFDVAIALLVDSNGKTRPQLGV